MNLDEARRLFFDEAGELLLKLEELLLQLEQADADEQTLAALFRCAHTIKGSAGIFGFDSLVDFMHGVEAELSSVRNKERELDPPLISALLRCKDHAQRLLEVIINEEQAGPELLDEGGNLLAQLSAPAGQLAAPSVSGQPAAPVSEESSGDSSSRRYQLSFHPGLDVYRRGLDPLTAIRQLAKFSDLKNVHTDLNLPSPLAKDGSSRSSAANDTALDFDPESCLLSFRVEFETKAPAEKIGALFEFFRSDSEVFLEELDLRSAVGGGPSESRGPSEQTARTGPESAARASAHESGGSALSEADTVNTGSSEGGGTARSSVESSNAGMERPRSGFVRVDTAKLDRLINLVGELVIAGAHMNELASHTSDTLLAESGRSLSRMIADLRDQSLRVRMVPLAEAFSRFHRAVRETALSTNKQARLEVRVGDSEMDKNLIEAISEPLLHIVRNSVDHGIESPEERIKAGKPAQGTVGIRSYRETGSIVLEIWDDGRGFDIARIVATARARGLLGNEAEVPESEALRLLFLPGFSTRETITNISGRGVGMDVVQRGIEALRGTVSVQNRVGGGSLTRVRLPLTLAIIEGFLVRVGRVPYVIPMELVTECVEFDAALAVGRNNVLRLRDEMLPFLRPAELFAEEIPAATRENVVVVEYAERRVGLVVQGLLGEFQAVIKPLNRMFVGLHGISGATILGDGSVALILDVPSLIDHVLAQAAPLAGGLR